MIDLHNHILPALDDGALDLTESVEIARQFVREGVVEIVATPHLDPLHGRGASPATIRAAVETVQRAIVSEQIPLAVHVGQEVFLTPEIQSLLAAGAALPLAGSRYVLVEVSLVALERPVYLDDILFKLQLAEYRPVLTHPERYPFVQRDPDVGAALAGRGVALQLTAPALLGEYGARVRRTAQRLLALGAYGLAGSDRHHPGPRRSLAALYHKLREDYGSELPAILLTENPRRILDNRPLLACDPVPGRSGLSLARLFRR